MTIKSLERLRVTYTYLSRIKKLLNPRCYHQSPFFGFYQKSTGQTMPKKQLEKIKKRHPHIETLSHDRLQCILQILQKFGITPLDACQNMHIFSMNPITMDNYGEILKECKFVHISPEYIIKYHTIIKSKTISELKKKGLISTNVILEEAVGNNLHDWPASHKSLENFPESTTSILTVRMNILEKYLNWKLSVTSEEFNKYCRNYLPLKHKPMCDIQEALNLAQKEIQFDNAGIKRNGFIIAADPLNTKLILENVETLAGHGIRDALKIEPAILKNNYNALLRIRDLLEEYRIPLDAQRRCLKIYCMCPETVKERLEELKNLKEYRVLSTNPRVLSMVVHKKKMINRLNTIQAAKKQCYSLNHLISSTKVFNNYINSFGNKVCGRDLAILIGSCLNVNKIHDNIENVNELDTVKTILKKLKRHKYWLHCALNVIDRNMQFLKKHFADQIILNNCQLLLYPVTEVEYFIKVLLNLRDNENPKYEDQQLDMNCNILKFDKLSDNQLLSLVLYQMEKRYHFSGDGVWSRQDGVKIDTMAINQT